MREKGLALDTSGTRALWVHLVLEKKSLNHFCYFLRSGFDSIFFPLSLSFSHIRTLHDLSLCEDGAEKEK